MQLLFTAELNQNSCGQNLKTHRNSQGSIKYKISTKIKFAFIAKSPKASSSSRPDWMPGCCWSLAWPFLVFEGGWGSWVGISEHASSPKGTAVTTSILEQMGTHSQQHKRYNSPFYQTKCKTNNSKSLAAGYPTHPTFTTPPFSTCLHILLHTMNRSTMNPMQIAHL